MQKNVALVEGTISKPATEKLTRSRAASDRNELSLGLRGKLVFGLKRALLRVRVGHGNTIEFRSRVTDVLIDFCCFFHVRSKSHSKLVVLLSGEVRPHHYKDFDWFYYLTLAKWKFFLTHNLQIKRVFVDPNFSL